MKTRHLQGRMATWTGDMEFDFEEQARMERIGRVARQGGDSAQDKDCNTKQGLKRRQRHAHRSEL